MFYPNLGFIAMRNNRFSPLPPLAAIDIGSNSMHLVIAKLNNAGELKVIDSDKVSIRLGQHLSGDGVLSKIGIKKLLETIQYFLDLCASHDASVRAVATHALREAVNHVEILEEVQQKTGLKVEIIEGFEEARLVFLGMRYGLNIERHHCLGIDIGGGSTEIILGRGDHVNFVSSIKLGAVTLTKRHFGDGGPSEKRIRSLYDYIHLRLDPLVPEIRPHNFSKAIASSGTAKALASIHSRMFRGRPLSDENGYVIPMRDLKKISQEFERLKSPQAIKAWCGIESSRADIILAGAAVLNTAGQMLKVSEWTVTTCGLREGVVVDYANRLRGQPLTFSHDIRWEQVVELGKKCYVDEPYAAQVMQHALQLFDYLKSSIYDDKVLAESDREFLKIASFLHEVGKFISFTAYHKHTYYIVNNSRLLGFSQDERHFIGLIALLHRKGLPSRWSPDCEVLTDEEFRRMTILAGVLRMASALNRGRRGAIKSLKLLPRTDSKLNFRLVPKFLPNVEIQQLDREKQNIERLWGVKFQYSVAPLRKT
jgi:exopolyphosphatase/guanosine-5'-triphosphate,3'-diphosphate pyrophosphatase